MQITIRETPDLRWLRCLTSGDGQRRVLVRCCKGGSTSVAAHVMSCGTPPVRVCWLPGPLRLPPDRTGTLVLDDVAALRIDQQIALSDWLGSRRSDVRVVSLTDAPLAQLVESGMFLEGLLHRLGEVQLDLDLSSAPCDLEWTAY